MLILLHIIPRVDNKNHAYKIYDSIIDSAVQHKDLGITLSSD